MIGLSLRQTAQGPAFMVVDADPSRWDDSPELGAPMTAAEVTKGEVADEVYAILDAVGDSDARLTGWRLGA